MNLRNDYSAKRSHYKDQLYQFKFDMKKTWAVLSEIINKNNQNSVPGNMTVNGSERVISKL